MKNSNADSHALQELVMPSPELMLPEGLYWSRRRKVGYDSEKRLLHFAKGGELETDSFFNAFAAKQWFAGGERHHLVYKLNGEGCVDVEIKSRHGDNEFLLCSSTINFESGRDIELALPDIFRTHIDADKILFAHLVSAEGATIKTGGFFTQSPPRNRIKIAIVITHFKREEWVLPAVERLRSEFFTDATVRELAHIFVIDNSCSLPMESDESFTVVRNRNLGGSGGFMRGLLEAENAGVYSHCLFMDDDATTEVESIKRAIRYLSYSDPRSCVAGALNLLEKPAEVFESKGDWFEAASPVCFGLDVGSPANLEDFVRNDERGRYAGWWFFAFPIREVAKYSFPYFVRGDDVAFGLDNKFRMRSLLGVACWAESFESKDSITTTYLDYRASFRNSLVLKTCSSIKLIRRLITNLLGILASYRYAATEAALMGVWDSMQDRKFWIDNLDMTKVRERIAPLAKEETYLSRLEVEQSKDICVPPLRKEFKESFVRWVIRKATLNGHLIPSFLCPSDVIALAKTHIPPSSMVFPHTRFVMRRSTDDAAVLFRRDLSKAVGLLGRIAGVTLVYAFHAVFFRKHIIETHNLLTTREFWLDVYPECRKQSAAQTESTSPVVAK